MKQIITIVIIQICCFHISFALDFDICNDVDRKSTKLNIQAVVADFKGRIFIFMNDMTFTIEFTSEHYKQLANQNRIIMLPLSGNRLIPKPWIEWLTWFMQEELKVYFFDAGLIDWMQTYSLEHKRLLSFQIIRLPNKQDNILCNLIPVEGPIQFFGPNLQPFSTQNKLIATNKGTLMYSTITFGGVSYLFQYDEYNNGDNRGRVILMPLRNEMQYKGDKTMINLPKLNESSKKVVLVSPYYYIQLVSGSRVRFVEPDSEHMQPKKADVFHTIPIGFELGSVNGNFENTKLYLFVNNQVYIINGVSISGSLSNRIMPINTLSYDNFFECDPNANSPSLNEINNHDVSFVLASDGGFATSSWVLIFSVIIVFALIFVYFMMIANSTSPKITKIKNKVRKRFSSYLSSSSSTNSSSEEDARSNKMKKKKANKKRKA
ncbi:hypothetical protein BLOT_008244 [Blomia tropicalis]|nr:hypothetical protein BLOT_008244 [Blomia tropicalis]